MSNTNTAVNFKHFRNFEYNQFCEYVGVSGKGGVTMAYRDLTPEERELNEITNPDCPAIFVGFAGCSAEDNYDKKLGRAYATQRLATSKCIYAGDEMIFDLIHNSELDVVADIIDVAMKSQGIHVKSCI